MNPNLITIAVAVLAFLAIGGIGIAFTSGGDEATKKRTKAISQGSNSSGRGRGNKVVDENVRRRAKTQEMLETLRKQDRARKRAIAPQDIKSKLTQAGLSISLPVFWMGSLLLGALVGGGVYASGFEGVTFSGIAFKNRYVLSGMAAFVGVFGIPNFLITSMIKGRHKKMVNQFADGLDIIVRGVKSGLPLNECIRIISRESPEPLRSEVGTLADNLAMGANLDRALSNFYKRVPLQEVNFFTVVLLIQAKAGGNLAEALGNLSAVIRARRMMREKIKALSSEAKASAMIIGFLPFGVSVMLYFTSPGYVMELFTKETGHMLLLVAAGMMFAGIMTMRKMINFNI